MLTPTSNASSGRVGGLEVRIDHDSVVHVAGDVDFATAPPLEAALQSLVDRGGVVVDLACVEYMGAVGIHLLSDAARAIGARGRVVLRDPQPIVRLLIDITHLERLVDVVVTAPGRQVVAPSDLLIV